MENKFLHLTALRLANYMNRYTRKEGLEFQKMVLGLEILLANGTKIIAIYILSAFLGIIIQTLTIHGAFALIKRYSFGLHALSSTVCTVVSCALFVFSPFFLTGLGIGNHIVIVAFLLVILALYLYAPADTKTRPLIGIKLRAGLKVKAVICGIVLMAVTLLVPSEHYKLLLVLGAVFQGINILPVTYKILKRSERNYEAYENA